MASDYTWPADDLAGSPRAILRCPSCKRLMVADGDTLQWHLKVGTLTTEDLPVGFWTFSHTVRRSVGGKEGALECSTCNSDRNDRWDWVPPTGTRVTRQGKLANYRPAHEEAKAFREQVREWLRGGPLPL